MCFAFVFFLWLLVFLIFRAGLWIKSDSKEEETVVQNLGSSFWSVFLILGLFWSGMSFWVSSSSCGFHR